MYVEFWCSACFHNGQFKHLPGVRNLYHRLLISALTMSGTI